MEGDNVQLVDDNCSQIEVAFKRMKVGTSRCTGKKSHHHIYNHHQSNHYHHTHHPPQQLTPSPPPLQHQQNHHQDQLSSPPANQLSHHLPDLHQSHLSNQIISPNKTRVNPYYNQMFNTNTRVIPESLDDDTVDRLSSVDKSETISFSSFSASPLAQLNNFPSSNTTSPLSSLSSSSSSSASSSSSISPSSAVTPLSSTCTFMGPYRDVAHSEGQTDNLDHHHPNNHQSNQNNTNNNYHLNQSNHENTKYEDGPTADPDVSVEELAAYLDVQLYIPRKMSYMAELMYT